MLLGIACLSIVFGFALFLWAIGLPLSWTVDYDKVSYVRITKAIAADAQHLCGRRHYEVSPVGWVETQQLSGSRPNTFE